jgi:S-DNA-T family DNA segregation ATPase FtsK/SpoIIIE
MAVAAVYLVLVLASYSPQDPSWSHSSSDPTVRNYGGAFGAWLSDMLLYIFGLSAWWLVVFCLVAIAWGYRRMETLGFRLNPMTLAAMGGFFLLLLSSSSVEGIVLAGKQLNLPLSPGGMLGHWLGKALAHGLGQSGAYLLLSVTQPSAFPVYRPVLAGHHGKIGGTLEDGVLKVWHAWQARKDREIGRETAQQREVKVSSEKKKQEDKPPVRIEATTAEIPVSPKAQKPVQQSLFADPNSGELPGLSLLEAPKDQHEPVSAETVEYTSRLIERKLADFGVDVKVIAAYPGPVITRYEIEPAVGVKGAQIVNLMKDLAAPCHWYRCAWWKPFRAKPIWAWSCPTPNGRSSACRKSSARMATRT